LSSSAARGWQGANSLIAIGSGGFWGLGLGQGRQKQLYLPEPANDFIFSVACEELGFVGAVLILLIFAALIWRGYYIALHANDKFGTLLAAGITTQIAVQVVINLCVVTGLSPVTGASLPFFSYGGTALLIQLAEMGILLAISRKMPRT
jgi:cell division protein FtsW